jgi:release factor glutamine methyltransferase
MDEHPHTPNVSLKGMRFLDAWGILLRSESTMTNLLSLDSLRLQVIQTLSASGITEPDVDTELLLGHVLGLSRGEIHARLILNDFVSDENASLISALARRRAAREPLQHILGVAWFRSLTLEVGPGVFVPRPETEQLAQMAIDALRVLAEPAPIGVDLGTGSGAIALAMASEVPHARIFAVEKSSEAMPWTTKNFAHVGADNATLIQGDLTDAFSELNGLVAVVASNPPYIPNDAIPRDPEVQLHDPHIALYGGDDGLDIVRLVSQAGLRLARCGGALMMEHGELQGEAIRTLLTADGWRAATTHRDLLGRDRYTSATKP